MNLINKEKIVKFFKEIIEAYDFEILIYKNENSENIFKLNDIQKGNLGGIEQEEFFTLADIVERLEIYHQDYIYKSLENRKSNNETIPKNDWDIVVKRYLESDTIVDILAKIQPREYLYLTNKKEKFETQDIIKILDEEEKFYKSVCEKYVETMSKEMLLENDNKILHIFIEDDYIELKEAGKININNYEQYLDGSFEVYEYDYYQDLYNYLIKDEIAYDLNDLALFDENEKWDFYITFEELKKVGYGFMVKDHYPLLEKYILSEKTFDFYNHFSLEELDYFEKTLYLYFETDDIVYDEDTLELYSKSNSEYNSNIIYCAEGLISYEEFMEDYTEHIPTYYELSLEETITYFRENNIKDLMQFGSDRDEGLYKLSSMYEEIMSKLNIEFNDIYTEDGISDGKYITTIIFKDFSKIEIDSSAWNGIATVAENLESIYEGYEKTKIKIKQNEIKNNKEFDYDLN